MQLVQRGQAPAFEVIYERHSQAAFSLAYRMAGSRGVAEDVVQEAFLNLWRSGARYERARGSVRTWILGIVHHRGDRRAAALVRAREAPRERRGARGDGSRRASAPTSRPPATRRPPPSAPRSGTSRPSRAR